MGIVVLNKGYQPRNNIGNVENVDWLQSATVFCLARGNIFLSCPVYMGLVTLGR
jgi:hypothetical protein